MASTKIITDTIDLSSDTTGLKMPTGTTAQRPDILKVDYLVVAGGGGGGSANWNNNAVNGGGGAGGYRNSYASEVSGGNSSSETTLRLSTSTAYSVIVGSGGAGSTTAGSTGTQGGNSTFASITSIGGGGGASDGAKSGGSGGSGGGAAGYPPVGSVGSGTSGQGNDGGPGTTAVNDGGSGGGAGAAGTNGTSGSPAAGGVGLASSITGVSVVRASGGSSHSYDIGAANTGDGGGAWYYNFGGPGGGAGGSGVVIIRTPSNYTATFTSGVTANGNSGSSITPDTSTGDNVWIVTATSDALQTVTFSGTVPSVGTTRENTTTGKMEIYTGAKGWRALQQTGQDVGVVSSRGFGTALYVGNGGADSINLNFQPDLIWIKGRDTAGKFPALYDSVRGSTNMISTASTDYGSWNPYGSVTPNTSGFDIGSASAGDINTNTENYVSWSWKAGGNSNTFNIDGVGYATAAAAGMNAGSISPNACSVSTEYGFSITKYDSGICGTSNPPCFNWSHGLNQEPDFVTNKMLNYSYGWDTIFKPAGYSGGSNTGGWQFAQLDTSAAMGSSPHYSADSTLLYETMSSGASYPLVTYAWHSVPGYSLISTYTGTGTTDFPIIYTGFEPAWLMIKRIDSTGDWYIWDDKRSTSNLRLNTLDANTSDAELLSTGIAGVRFLNNGFQVQSTYTFNNAAGGEYLFMCFAS